MDTISKYNTLMQLLKLLCSPKRLWEWEAGLGKVMVVVLMYYIPECSVCFSTVQGLGGSQTPLLPWEPFTPVWHHKSISAFYYKMNQQYKKIQHAWPKCTISCMYHFLISLKWSNVHPRCPKNNNNNNNCSRNKHIVIFDRKENSRVIPQNLRSFSGGMLCTDEWGRVEKNITGKTWHFRKRTQWSKSSCAHEVWNVMTNN